MTSSMFERLPPHVNFWSALSVITSALGGVFAVRADIAAQSVEMATNASSFNLVTASTPSFIQLAPYLSFAAFVVALISWRRLHREIGRRFPKPAFTVERAQLWHDAIQANDDGIFLLRAIRDTDGHLIDFEVSDSNRGAAQFVGGTPALLIGRRVRHHFPTRISDYLMEAYGNAHKSGVPFTEDIRVNRRLFSAGWLFHQVVPTRDGVAVTIRDISNRKREEARLRRASITDELTLLFNRRGFLALADQQLRVARRQGTDSVLLYVDLDEFKTLNDRHGHAEGDKALIAVGRLLRRAVRDSDVVARLGGDEFTVLAIDADRAGARLIQKRIEERVAKLNASGLLAGSISLTVGHTRVRPTDHAPLAELLARADGLLYARKKRRQHMALVHPNTAAETAEANSHQIPLRRVHRRASRVASPVTAAQ